MGRRAVQDFEDEKVRALFKIFGYVPSLVMHISVQRTSLFFWLTFSAERVAEGVLQLITDDTKAGAALVVTKDLMEYPNLAQFDTPEQ